MLTNNYSVTSGKRGTVEFDAPAGTQISALGLRATPVGALTTIPTLVTVSCKKPQLAVTPRFQKV